MAQEYYPLTLERAKDQGFRWRTEEEKTHAITIPATNLPDHIKDAPATILQETIGCLHDGGCNEKCTQAFRLTPDELAFYKQYNLALPRLCPNCRHFRRLRQRNPFKLWTRGCHCNGTQSSNNTYTNSSTHAHGTAPCTNTFETPYSPERPEIVYCESCYQTEVA